MNPQNTTARAAAMAAPASPVTTTQKPPGGASAPMSEFERLLDKKSCEFVPFGGQDKIRLTVANVQNLIAVPTRSGKTCSERDAQKFIMMCLARRLNPFEGDAYLIGYDAQNGPTFSLITAHQAFLKRAEVHPEFDGMRSGVILMDENHAITEREGDFHLSDEQVLGGWAEVHFKNRKIPTKRTLRLERFNTGRAQWEKDPAGMIVKCAEADALRSSFPTMVGGLFLSEELDFMPDAPASRPLFEEPKNHSKSARSAASALDKKTEPMEPANGNDGGQAEPGPEPEPENKKVEPRVASTTIPGHTYNPLVALRNLAKMTKIKEAEILDFWAKTGATNGEFSGLEDVALSNSALVGATAEKWEEFSTKLKEARGERGAAE